LREEIDRLRCLRDRGASRPLCKPSWRMLSRSHRPIPQSNHRRDGNGQGADCARDSQAVAARARAFVSVNCAAIPPALIGRNVFGHEKGAFNRRDSAPPRRSSWRRGPIFLDEIGTSLDTRSPCYVCCRSAVNLARKSTLRPHVRRAPAAHVAGRSGYPGKFRFRRGK